MLVSKLYAPTLREVPAEAEIPSHKLMLRAGYMRKSATGMYSYLPLAQRVLQKIETIIREELNAIDSQEILMPIVQPAEIWQQSGRWDVYGAEMWRLKDRHGHDYCLGPTHEEMITTLAHMDVNSYRQLPEGSRLRLPHGRYERMASRLAEEVPGGMPRDRSRRRK